MADKVLIDRAVVEQALEALENCSSEYGHRCNRCDSEVDEGGKVASALRAALAQAEPVQEPVAWMRPDNRVAEESYSRTQFSRGRDKPPIGTWTPLYTAPPQQAEPVCKCDLRTRLLGDGCDVCNPELAAELAQQAEPDHETRAELAEQQVVQLAEERDHYRRLWQKAQQAEPVQQQAEPVQFNPAEALRLAEEFAQMKQAHGVFCNADSRRLMEEAHSALAAYLGIKGGGND